MNEIIIKILEAACNNRIIQIVTYAVIADTVFGCLRAVREHKFNSCFGIDGAIRKVSMLCSVAGFMVFDTVVNINLITYLPAEIKAALGVSSIGTAEFFSLLFIAYETVSILKNMTLCGLPVKGVWDKVRTFLANYTDELPDSDEVK